MNGDSIAGLWIQNGRTAARKGIRIQTRRRVTFKLGKDDSNDCFRDGVQVEDHCQPIGMSLGRMNVNSSPKRTLPLRTRTGPARGRSCACHCDWLQQPTVDPLRSPSACLVFPAPICILRPIGSLRVRVWTDGPAANLSVRQAWNLAPHVQACR